ncbi:hypothetical protein DdX_01751 [Ditylenchus destructor]|uniref:Uncharacterized protein n=1 Tax=Ditylenchus destructor TaxID=166010 RepID=A0AAD4NL47_9BILA|nr:hypothetical protein DdX_01751 [Ditylenchus destructor]
MTVNPFVKVSQYLADLAASYNQGEGSASSRDSLLLHDSEENHVESLLDDSISNPTDHTHSVHLRLSSQRRRMAQEKIAAVRNNPLKFVSLANSSFAAGNGLAYKAREQMSIVEQQKAVRAHLLQMQQNCSNANDEEENNWQEHLELWRRKRISAILSTQTQENLDTDSKFENSNAKMNARRHSAADVLDHATHSNTPFSQPDRESTLRTGQVYISQNSLNFLVKEEVSLIITS